MTWVISTRSDQDKSSDPGVGSIIAIFTDKDGSTLTVSQRGSFTPENATAFFDACVAELAEWQAAKTREADAMDQLVTVFNDGGQTGSVADTPSNRSISLPPAN